MLKTNKDKLVVQSVQGKVHHPTMGSTIYRVGYDGIPRVLPAVGGITYSHFIGDSCMGIVGDHIEPGVSSKNGDKAEDTAFNVFSCIGNKAKVVTGDAKGSIGYVSGKHGGIDHVIIAFDSKTLDKMVVNDQILVYATGQGLQLLDHQDITCMNIDPSLLEKLNIKEIDDKLVIDVTHVIGGELIGSGVGSSQVYQGDFDIMTQDESLNKKYNLNTLRFGDIVMVKNCYSKNGPIYKKDAITIGVVVHSDSFSAGHGPGISVILTCDSDKISSNITTDANLSKYFKI